MLFVKVAESENPEDSVEIPVEPQGHILMSTLTAQFPGACGLKFKTEQFSWRGVRVVEDKLYPPGDDKWDSNVYIVTYPKDSKRKGDDLDINSAKSRKIERKCVDLIVLGIPWKSTEEVVRRYFEQYGEVVLCEIKRDAANNSKGFGFVRFKEYNNQCSVLGKKHFIDGRWCDVKIPNSQEPETSRKIFVGRLSENLTSKDLQDYFSQYGQVIDVYIPKPFRAFGFVTFVEADVAQGLCGESHIIKGVSVHVSRADPKEEENSHSHNQNPHSHHNSNSNYQHHHNNNGNNPHHHNHHQQNNSHHGGGGIGNGHYNNNNQMNHRNESSRRFSSNGPNAMPKSMGQMRKKYDNHHNHHPPPPHHHHHHHNDLYESRHNDVRSPNMPPPPPPPPAQHHNGNGAGMMSGSNGIAPNDQMNAMMNMFNPMMAAFIQQLASQTMPPNSQDGGSNGAAAAAAAVASMTGHHGHPPPPPQWSGSNGPDFRNGGSGGPNANGGGYGNQSGGNYSNGHSLPHSRFKSNKIK
jgi:TAR DNA-binding protein 43